MAEQNNQVSYCTFVALSETETCKLPLLDGEASESAETIITELELENAGNAREIYHDDRPLFYGAVCIAWALLLRCYTGQEQATFRFNHDKMNTTARLLRTVFDDEVLLSKYVKEAEKTISRLGETNNPAQSSKSASNPVNTTIYISDSASSGILGAKPQAKNVEGDVTLNIELIDDTFRLSLHSWSSDVSSGYAKSLTSTFSHVLTTLLLSPDRTLKSLDFLNSDNETQLSEWNQTPLEPVDRCLNDLIHEQVQARPNNEAICAWDGSVTYRNLWRYVESLAQKLMKRGVGPGVVVPLCFEKSFWASVAMLAVMEAGAGFCPLDASQPIPRLESLAQRLEAKVLLCSRKYSQTMASVAGEILPLDAETFEGLSDALVSRVSRATPSDVAYVLWTSGSTGEPKGVVIEHRAYCSSARAHTSKFSMNPDSRVLQYASYVFDASILENLTPLMLGATVCVPSESSRLNGLSEALNQMRVNWAELTPTVLNFLRPTELPGLRHLLLMGEAMSRENMRSCSGTEIKLMNAYGPAECSVAATLNPDVPFYGDSALIGYPMGVKTWLVDPENHDRLLPPGCIGELLIEGPTLARGYLNDVERTRNAFIENPLWTKQKTHQGTKRRMYKTGDLARYHTSNGMLYFIGRKDTQVKHHGQRIELGEIELHLQACHSIERGIVVMPNAGLCSRRLVAAISLKGSIPANGHPGGPQLVNRKNQDKARPIVDAARGNLSSQLPAFMIPSVWLVYESIPLLKSGKLDRKAVVACIQEISDEEYSRWARSTELIENEKPATELEAHLRFIWSHVLNLQPDQISLTKQSFLKMGGDSISAMMVQNHCKKRSIGITVQNILSAKSITHLASFAQTVERNAKFDEKIEEDFDLSPIQSLYFELPREKGHFNQSFFVQLTKPVEPAIVHQAAKTIVNRHSMLRARFRLSTLDDEWKQRITTDVVGSYSFRTHQCASKDDAVPAMSKSQSILDPIDGPLFAVDLFDIPGGNQLLFMTAHHLVVDLVSWRVILDEVQEILTNPTAGSEAEPSISFQAWCKLQHEHAQKTPINAVLPTNEIPAQSFEYWGIKSSGNTYGNASCEGFELDTATTTIIMSECHHAMRTEPLDLLLAALIHSFSRAFPDRPSPAIFNEGHGREIWDSSIDLSRTIGWFTTIYPVYIASADSKDFADTLRCVKDYRRSVSGNGRPYFASRLLTAKGAKRFRAHWPLEITFNYLGTYQQLERADALLVPAEEMAGEARAAGGKADYGHETPRFGLFEISAVIVQGKLRYSFTFNKGVSHLDKVKAWISGCQDTLRSMPSEIARMSYSPTLSDFPLLSIDYAGLQKLTLEKIPSLGIDLGNIEDIYKCSQIQQGLLISTKRDAGFYAVEGTHEVKPAEGRRIDSRRLADAWQSVVDRHASLRTLFVESQGQLDALYDQLILRNVNASIERLTCSCEDDVTHTFERQGKMELKDATPAHRFSICETDTGKFFFKLEISHTLIDGQSMSTIYRELVSAYEARLPEEAGPAYSSYISFLQTQQLQTGIGYWKSHLAGIEPTTFPVLKDADRTERQLRSQHFNYEQLENLQSFSEIHGVTMANIFHTAWALTLQCYTGSRDVCFGYLMSTRDPVIAGVEDLIGYLVNMVVCRVQLSQNTPLTSVMQQVQKDLSDAQSHRQTALSEVLHALKLSGDSLFNTSLSYRKLPPATAAEHHEISFEEHQPYYDPTEYNVSINIEVSEEAAAIDLDYWTDCLSEGHATNVAETFFKALENIIEHSEEEIGRLNGVSELDRQLIMSWNKNVPPTIRKTVHEVVSEQVARYPGKEAICAWDASLSYAELDLLAEKLAGYLRSQGVGAESFVCLCCEKSAYTPVTQLGVLKAGGAFASLDPMHPTSALEMRIQDTKAEVILTSPCYNALFSGMGLHVVSVDAAFLNQLQVLENTAVKSAEYYNPCCTIYTSGSTGKPKGVVLEHSALVTSADAHGSVMGFDETTRALQYASYTFDNSLEETFTTLMRGGTVCVPSDHDRMNDVAGAVNKLRANFMDLTPTVATYLNPAEMRGIKFMSLGGEALTKAVLNVWGDEVIIYNQYGPCECSINSTYRTNLHKDSDPTSIGQSVGSVSWIVDPNNHSRLVPVGCEGELLIEGPILARGYLNDKEKTVKAFIEDPEWAHDYEPKLEKNHGPRRMYKTGDLVRYNSDGMMDYAGRKDHQVKLHGQRIELGEIEYHIRNRLPPEWQFGVELVAPGNVKMLALFACPQKDGSATTSESNLLPMSTILQTTFKDLEAALTKSLPKHMVPSMYLPLANLPLSSSGKLDRKQLKALALSLTENQVAMYRLAGNSGRAPSSEVEKILAGLWETLLHLETASIGMDSQFFRMGGDSIAAIRLVTAARSKGVGLTVANIFRNGNLTEMCATAQVSDSIASESSRPGPKPFGLLPAKIPVSQVTSEVTRLCNVEQNKVVDIYPCTPMQEGLIALSSKKPGAYVAQTTYRMSGVNVENFKAAWQAVVADENILRTRIVFSESLGFLQTVVDKPIAWSEPASLNDKFDAKEFQSAHSGGGLSNYAIVRGQEDEFFFVWTIHHALYDRWSIPLILQKVRTHYYEGPKALAAAPKKGALYPQFIRFLLNENKAESSTFWQARLARSASPQYPALPKPTYQPSATGRFLRFMPISRKPGAEITMPMLVRAAWGFTISAYSNSDDVVFGEIFSGRDTPLPGISDMTGPAFAIVPIRVQAGRDLKVGNYLKRFQEEFAEALPYQHMGLLRIKRIDDDTNNACEFQNLISINNEVPDTSDLFEVEEAAGSGAGFFTYGLTVAFDVHATEIELDAHYDPQCISQWQVERLLKYFECALTQLAAMDSESAQLREMRTLLAEDEATIKDWNNKAPMHVEKCVHDIVHDEAESLPLSTPAIHAWDGQFTYRELDLVATAFAHHLLDLGIGHQSYVPICFEKTALVVISMLAIMKVGAAFVPIDGAAPKARLQGIVQDADATHILCSPKYMEVCYALGARTVVVDRETVMDCSQSSKPLPRSAGDDIAYIIFTSGSTGKPKGTLVSHTAFSSGALAHGPAMGMCSTSRVLQFASYTFDASVMEILSTLLLGGCVCIPDDKTRLDDVAKGINELDVNWSLLTPSFAKLLSPSKVPGLKILALGGEAMSQSDVLTWAGRTRLVNAYGPSETAVVATVQGHVTPTSQFSSIGKAVGSRCFIVNRDNHDELVPVGAVGELVVNGPILASGYLKERIKTEQAFIPSPSWLKRFQIPQSRSYEKIYKTGDLVRYTEDGSFLYSGRKDNQTKLNGQRLELGEIEHHLRHDSAVKHALALIPASGHFKKRLVAVLSFQENMKTSTSYDDLGVVAQEVAAPHVERIQDYLRNHLQPFMVPSSWVSLLQIPMLPSGKLDRKRITGWLETMPDEVNQKITGSDSEVTNSKGTDTEEKLQRIWSKALDLPMEKTGLEKNFLFLGGDSISALQVLSQCRSEGIILTVQDIIRSRSIRQLASTVTFSKTAVVYEDERFDLPFNLSPMQSLYFDWVGDQVHHFNQSALLRLSRRQTLEDISLAMKTLIKSHSMLRARFYKNADGKWVQKLSRDGGKSYRFMFHPGKSSPAALNSSLEKSQRSLDIEAGPIFAADLFEYDECGSQVLALVAHHLVIDIVSWNIIQGDLEELLTSKKASTHNSLPFQTWCRFQEEHQQGEPSRGLDFNDEIPTADFGYWGMSESKNTYGAIRSLELEVDTTTTKNLLGPCNQVIATEPIDILLGSILFSFCKTFSDRKSMPAVFNEAHGREPWDASLDLSHTVGWFTTISPVFLPSEATKDNDILNAIRWVKDLRSRTVGKGRQYFAHRMLTKEGKNEFNKYWPMEIAFNYSGQEKMTSRENTLLQSVDGVSSKFDIDPTLPRFALFEIGAGVSDDVLKLSFGFPQSIRRQHSIKLWMTNLDKALHRACEEMLRTSSESTLNDFPLLPLTYKSTQKLQDRLNTAGIPSLAEVEDVYGSSPMQQGVLLSQVKDPSKYMYQAIFVPHLSKSLNPISAKKLARAWTMVVRTHPSLRTVFIESMAKEGLMDQAVVKTTSPKIVFLQSHPAKAVETLKKQASIIFTDRQPHHQFTVCETTSGKVFCKLELSHSICDGTSVSVIFQDLAKFYNVTSDKIQAAPTNREYITYLRKSSYESNLNYWRRYLQHAEPCAFPSLLDGTVIERENKTFELKLENLAGLNSFCAHYGATLSNFLQLVWSLVLRVYTGNENVCFGYITSGRDVPVQGVQDAVGLFISMLVCRIDLSADLMVEKALEQIQDDYSKSMPHQAFSLSNMQHELGSGQALFNTVFTFQRRFKPSVVESDQLDYDVLHALDPGEYPLTVNVEALEAGIDVQFNYWTDFLCETQASNIADTFEQILLSVMDSKSSQLTVGAINFCSERHEQQIFDWNDKALPKVDRCVHDVIYQQSQDLPLTAPAVCSWDEDLTYMKLMSLSKRLAKHLTALGVGPDKYVPLCFEKSTWAIVAMLGVLQAGGAFVPLEPSHPESRIKYIIGNVDANIVLCSAKYSEKFSDLPDVTTFVVDESFTRMPQPLSSGGKALSPTPANAAYLIFTSGTTGLPKGTIISHHAFATGATEHAPAILMRQKSRVLQFSNLCFDASVMEILTTLMTGACICIPSDEERMNDIQGAMNRMSVTWTLLTPSVAAMLTPETVPTLEVLVTGGEAMQPRHIAKWSGSASLVNAYGPSECAVIATTSIKVDLHRTILDEDSSNIGRGVGGRCWIVNPHDHNQLMPIGSVGELVVEGNTVARGYLNNEEKTSKAFVTRPSWMTYDDDEIATGHSKLIYKTGDLVRYTAHGDILYVARKDTQIKLNGLRIELGDIEHHVKQHLSENVEAVVEMTAPAGQPTTLAAFIRFPEFDKAKKGLGEEGLLLPMSDKITALAKDLKTKLTQAIPAYMVPSLYFPVSFMPWTPSGKLDRARFRKSIASLSQEDTSPYRLAGASNKKQSTEPTTAMEKSLQSLWASLLGVKAESIGSEDNFFAIGGDSVIGMRLGAAARAERISLSVFDIFRKPTLSGMAEACSELEEEEKTAIMPFSLLGQVESFDQLLDELAGRCRVDKERVADAYPCSPLQEGLIAISAKQAGAYVAHNAFRLPKSVNVRHFQEAWQTAVQEMDILRTRIVHTSLESFVQVVLHKEDVEWYTAKSIEDATRAVQLPRGNGYPLTRFTIVNGESTNDRYFVWSIHHAIYDGWSMPRMLQRVEDIYFQSSSQPVQAPYASYIGYLLQSDKEASNQFWRTKFRDLQSFQFPTLPQSASEQEVETRTLSHTVELPHKPKTTGITLPTLIRGAWAMLLASHTGSEDVVFGESLTGRDIPLDGIIDMLGPTLTTIPSRVQVRPGMKITEYLQNVHQMSAEAIPHQHIGLQHIKRLNSETAVACDFQNLLVIQTAEEEVADAKLWDPQENGISSKFFNYPFVLECDTSGGTAVRLSIHYNEEIISRWHVQRLVHQFESVLHWFCTASMENDGSLWEVQVVNEEDIQLIRTWNQQEPVRVKRCIHDLFLQQADRTPGSEAVCAWDGSFTYRELKGHVKQLSRHLKRLGVSPETLVPFCMDKSRWAIVAQLGIMLAGGAMVPLDPMHPLARHSDIIEDTQATFLVCSPQYQDRYQNMVEKVIPVDERTLPQLHEPDGRRASAAEATSGNVAYVIFTSGSTGRPKGVVIEHESICASSMAFCKAMKMDPKSRVFNFASFTFDVAVMENMSPLTMGACACIPNDEEKVSDLASAMNRVQPTWAFLTPSVSNLIQPSEVPSLRVLVVGGEAMSMENVIKWSQSVVLVNGYGPTEASVIAVTNDNVSEQKDPKNIGFAHDNSRSWVVDRNDHDRLAPLGCVGELVLEGPILAREYLHDKEKTEKAFIENPAWASRVGDPQRLYKTGDLVKYGEDGSIVFFGRKDNQIKLNGQRVELGEIESRLSLHERILHAIIVLPSVGPCKGRLVAVISLSDIVSVATDLSSEGCTLLKDPELKAAKGYLKEAQEFLTENLPAHMIPSVWAIVDSVPILGSGKIKRKQVERWIGHLNDAIYKEITAQEPAAHDSAEITETVQRLQEIWASVFNLPVDQINPNRSFMSQGGDSLLSMSIVSRCRKAGYTLTVQNVLQSKSLFQLAKRIDSGQSLSSTSKTSTLEEKTDQPFELSPVQQLYFEIAGTSSDHTDSGRFNQSQLLKINRNISSSTIRTAIETIVQQHSMFRAKFFENEQGKWQQKISSITTNSYHFGEHQISHLRQMVPAVAKSQTSLNIESGPLLAVDLFNTTSDGQILSLIAHHLVIDVVSWNIVIQQLEDLLTFNMEAIEKPVSFQTWLIMQESHTRQKSNLHNVKNVLPFEISRADMGFWNMDGYSNLYGDTKTEKFTLDNSTTELALGKSNETFGTRPIELLLAALIHSFNRVFPNRTSPTVFNEGHGRETWDASTNLSGTIGWFTSLSPIYVPAEKSNTDILDVLKQAKDLRRSLPGNGRNYFAHRFLTPDGQKEFGDHAPMEILFNYTGRSQNDEQGDSALQAFDVPLNEEDAKLTADVGPKAARMALFEITASVSDSQLEVSFLYNKHMSRQNKIHTWITEYQYVLMDLTQRLMIVQPEPTLSDFPLLSTNYSGLQRHLYETFSEVGISGIHDVEEMMVCAPMQDGLLLSQIKQPDAYLSYVILEVKAGQGVDGVDPERLMRAWQRVVDHHQMLRTTFAYSVSQGHAFDQIVLKHAKGGARLVESDDADFEDVLAKISLREVNRERKPMLPHQLSICTTISGRVIIKLELNHAVIDGLSVGLITRDLARAYESRLPGPRPLYSEYIRNITEQPPTAAVSFWKDYLNGAQRCHLPTLNPEPEDCERLNATYLNFERFAELQAFCRTNELTLSNVMLAAWALVLRRYTSQDDICFGNLSAGRDAPVEGIQDTVGAFINMLICRVNLTPSSTLGDVFRKVQSDFIQSLPHQHCPLARIQHDLGFVGEQIFNTACSIQNQSSSGDAKADESAIQFEEIAGHDPTEYAVTININVAPGAEGACIKYWTSHVSVAEAESMSRAYGEILGDVLTKPNQAMEALGSADENAKTTLTIPTPKYSAGGPPLRSSKISAHENDVLKAIEKTTAPLDLSTDMYRNIVKYCVHEVLEQLLKSGEFGLQQQQDFAPQKPEATLQRQDIDQATDMVKQKATPSRPKMARRHTSKDSSTGKFSESSDISSKTLRSLWSVLLNIPERKINNEHSFFELGGDSILAMDLARTAHNAGLKLTVADIFTKPIFSEMSHFVAVLAQKKTHQPNPSVAILSQAEILQQRELEQQARFAYLGAANAEAFIQDYICPKISVFRGGIVDVLPITDFQALSVTGALLGSRWMLNYFFFDGQGHLDLGRLKRAAFKLVQTFDILRTVFIHCGDRFWQVILRKLRPQFQVYETEEDLGDFTRNLRQSSLDAYPRLGEPFVQFSVIKKIGSNSHRIIMRISHAQYDGICLPKIIDALKALYEGKEVAPPPSFSNYVSQATGPANLDSYAYWKGLLRGSSMTSIVQRKQPKYDISEMAPTVLKKTFKLPALRSHNVTPATVLKAAWALTLAQMSGRSDIVFGNLISGRNAAVDGVEDIVGPCVNIIPVRVKLESKLTALDILKRIQGQQVDNMSYESLGFREIIQQCTNWPEWTYFSSVVQHQNISQDMPLRLDRNQYKVGFLGSGDNLSDFTILSTPKDRDMIEVALGFCDDGSIPMPLIEKAIDMMCSLAQSIARNPGSLLPTLINDSDRLPTTQLRDPVQPAEPSSLSETLRNLKKHEVFDMVDVLRRAWRIVLPKENQASSEVNIESSFWDMGGDLVSLAALTTFLQDEGYNVRLEDLVKRPKMGEQIAVLSLKKDASSFDPSSTSTLAGTPEMQNGSVAITPQDRSPERQAAPATPLKKEKKEASLRTKVADVARRLRMKKG